MRPRPSPAPAALLALLSLAGGAGAEEEAALIERPRQGDIYHVSARADLSGSLTPPSRDGKPSPGPVTIKGDSIIEYDERILELDADGLPSSSLRYCQEMAVSRTVGSQPQENRLRSEVKRLVVLRKGTTKAPFSPDGPLLWTEIDLVRTDMFIPLLMGLLPQKSVRLEQSWTASVEATRELTGLETITSGSLLCTLAQLTPSARPHQARVQMKGTVRGTSEDGPTEQKIDGYYLFDLTAGHLTYIFLRGTHSLLDSGGKEIGKIEGRFVLGRQPGSLGRQLTDEAIRGVEVRPDADNTMLLYDTPELPVRFLYPRRWRVAGVQGRQITLEAPEGAGLLLTVEPTARTPSGQAYLEESRQWLTGQRARILRVLPPRQIQLSPLVEYFSLELEMAGKKALMDYYVTRQAEGGVLIAARLPTQGADDLRKEAQQIARAIRVTGKVALPR